MQSTQAKAVSRLPSFGLIGILGLVWLGCLGCPVAPPPPATPELPDLQGRTIVVAVLEDNPPFSQVDATSGVAEGFEIDLIDEIAEKLNFRPQYVALDRDAALTHLNSGTYDVVAGGILYTLERATQVDFALAYQLTKLRLAVRAADSRATEIVEFHDQEELQVGAVSQTIAFDLAREYFGADRLNSYDTVTVAMAALAAGEIAGVVLETMSFDAAEQAEPGVFRRLPGTLAGNLRAFALRQGSDLTEPISLAIYELLDEGTIRALGDKWGI